jgi:hypothetical protein
MLLDGAFVCRLQAIDEGGCVFGGLRRTLRKNGMRCVARPPVSDCPGSSSAPRQDRPISRALTPPW